MYGILLESGRQMALHSKKFKNKILLYYHDIIVEIFWHYHILFATLSLWSEFHVNTIFSSTLKTNLEYVMRCAIWCHLYNFKNVKNTHGGVLILSTLVHGCFSPSLNCTNGTKSLNAPHILDLSWNRDIGKIPVQILIGPLVLGQINSSKSEA